MRKNWFQKCLERSVAPSVALFISFASHAQAEPNSSSGVSTTLKSSGDEDQRSLIISKQNNLQIILTLAWEGRDLKLDNLRALSELRRDYSDLKIMHFISPAYFLRSPEKASEYAQTIKQHILPGDRVGLLLNGWKRYIEKAIASPILHPTFWGAPLRAIDCSADCGLEVPVSAYSSDDLRKIIALGKKTLDQYGFGGIDSMQVSGWLSSFHVLESARAEEIYFDFSGVPPSLLRSRLQYFPLFAWIEELWKDVSIKTAPLKRLTPYGTITILPQNLAAVDYLDFDTASKALEDFLTHDSKSSPPQTPILIMGMHQESLAMNFPMGAQILNKIASEANKRKIKILSQLPARFELDAQSPSTPSLISAESKKTEEAGKENQEQLIQPVIPAPAEAAH